VQQTWVNTFNPELKFSGKEQDTESGLYYFGSRYYDPTLYRFLSPDPVIPTDRALYNPQRWNLYGYCGDNPVSNIEVNGLYYIGNIIIKRLFSSGGVTYGILIFTHGFDVCYVGRTQEKYPNQIAAGSYRAQFRWVDAYVKDRNGDIQKKRILALILLDKNGDPVTWAKKGEIYIAGIHSGSVDESNGCIIVDKGTMEFLQERFNYCWQQFEKASYYAMFGDQLSQVLGGFAALDWYSEFFASHYFWVEIIDPPKMS
jgi:RHS repeat-associated protein